MDGFVGEDSCLRRPAEGGMGYAAHRPQHELTVAREEVTGAMLDARFAALPATHRERILYANLDGFSSMFLQVVHDTDDAMWPSKFTELAAWYFFRPSPALAPFVGTRVPTGERGASFHVDPHGAKVMSSQFKGNSWVKYHAACKFAIVDMLEAAGLDPEAEPAWLFLGCAPPVRRLRDGKEIFQKVKALVPDIKFGEPSEGNVTSNIGLTAVLSDIKTVHECPTWYSSVDKMGAVSARATKVHREYKNRARKADREICEVVGSDGPFLRKLLTFKLQVFVVGTMGEVSNDIKRLVKICAKVGAGHFGRRSGAPSREAARSALAFVYKANLALKFSIARADCLFDRLRYVDPATRPVASRYCPVGEGGGRDPAGFREGGYDHAYHWHRNYCRGQGTRSSRHC